MRVETDTVLRFRPTLRLDPFGVSREIIEEGQNGFLGQHIEEWREAIGRLKNDVALRKRMGRRARAIAEEKYSLKVWGPRVAGMIDSL